jgi:hypothetical protein
MVRVNIATLCARRILVKACHYSLKKRSAVGSRHYSVGINLSDGAAV